LRSASRPAKAAAAAFKKRRRAMLAILIISTFIGVFCALNAFEFGRVD